MLATVLSQKEIVHSDTGQTITATGGDKGTYIGGHVNAYNVK